MQSQDLLWLALAVLAAGGTGWWLSDRRYRRRHAPPRPAFIAGKSAEWTDFERRHRRFLELFPSLKAAVNAAFQRTFESDRPVDPVVFYTGMVCAEEFLEILLLCANGYGLAALRLLRSLYERVVTIRYLSAHPDETDAYLDYHLVQTGKLARAALEAFADDLSEAQIQGLTTAVAEYDRVKHAFMITDCKKCETTRPNHTWSKLDFVAMAKTTGSTGSLLVPCYLDPLSQAHATARAFLARLKLGESGGASFDAEPQRQQADNALILSHNLLINVLDLQHTHFKLEMLDSPLQQCLTNFQEIWAGAH